MENKTVSNSIEEISKNVGNHIVFGGMGILDGLKFPCKFSAHKIIGLDEKGNLIVKQYRAKYNSILPVHNFNQGFMIIDKKEFKNLPEYC
jgi:UDP-3-O-acyl-N-acetylglucosamine deacetylase